MILKYPPVIILVERHKIFGKFRMTKARNDEGK